MNRYIFDEIEVGQEENFEIEITEEMMESFRKITGDINPLHNDEKFAKNAGYPGRVVYGMLTASFLSTMAGVYMPGENSLIQSVEVKFSKPVYTGDRLSFTGKVAEKNDTFRFIILKVNATIKEETVDRGRCNTKVLKATMQIGVAK